MSGTERSPNGSAAGPSAPHLSVVATSRNDDHGGDLLHRMQLFIDGLADQAERLRMPLELILVEWNPPADRPPLAEALDYPDGGGHLRSRVVTVSPELHRRFDATGTLPLFQMIAKNVGLRRALGRHVVATNIDILFSEPLAAYLAGPLEAATVYRVDRVDVDIPAGADLPRAREATHGTPVRICRKDGVWVPGRGRILPQYQSVWDYLAVQARARYEHLRGRTPAALADSGEGRARQSLGARLRDRREALHGLRVIPRLHQAACGDFTLLDRAGWDALRGYPEWPIFSWNVDTCGLYQAAAHGFRFVDLPAELPAYHMDHETGSGWTPEGREILFRRIEAARIDYLRDADLRRIGIEAMEGARAGRPPVYNGEHWGLADEDLPDVEVSGWRVGEGATAPSAATDHGRAPHVKGEERA